MPSYHTAKVISNDLIGPKIRHLKIETSEQIKFEAGQFVMMRIRDDQGEFVERAYSIANYTESGPIEFVVRITPDGKMSQLIDDLRPRTQADIKGPFGKFGLNAITAGHDKIVLIAAGVGIAPMRSIIQRSFQRRDSFPIQLFYGFRASQEFLFQQEFEKYKSSGRFSLISAISEPGENNEGSHKGYITGCLQGNIFLPDEKTQCFICGPPEMVKDCREKLYSLGFDRTQVHVEAW